MALAPTHVRWSDDPGDLRHDHADVVAAVRDGHPQQLLHRHAVAHVVDERRDVVEPVGVRHDAVVVHRLGHLLEAAMQVADLDVDVDDPLAVERGDDPDDPVHGGMRGPDVEQHLARRSSVHRPDERLSPVDRVVLPERMADELVVHEDALQVRDAPGSGSRTCPRPRARASRRLPTAASRNRLPDRPPAAEPPRAAGASAAGKRSGRRRRSGRPRGDQATGRLSGISDDGRTAHQTRKRMPRDGFVPKAEIVHGRQVHQQVHLEGRIVLERSRNLEQVTPGDDHRGIAAERMRRRHGGGETIAHSLNQGRGVHGSNTGLCIAGLSSGTGRWPVACCSAIRACSLSRPSSTYSGRGGQPGM